ncbi:transposase [bacterium]|nr:transposase [bacterium]
MGRTYTYQARLSLDKSQNECLLGISTLFNQIEHRLFAAYCHGESLTKLKNTYLTEYGITARHYNSIRIGLEGKTSAIEALNKEYIADVASKIKKTKGQIRRLSQLKKPTKKDLFSLHQKKRKLSSLEHKHRMLLADQKNNTIRMCFGSKKLFNKQFYLAENNYLSRQEWKDEWQDVRSSNFFLVGSKDETMGNQSCIASIQADGKLAVKIRIPDALSATYGKYLHCSNITFEYGFDAIQDAINENIKRNTLSKQSERKRSGVKFKEHGQAITYRFVRDHKGWRLFVTVTRSIKPTTLSEFGVIGVDINTDHLAVCEINQSGNYVTSFRIPLVTYGKSTEQTKAIIGDAIKQLVEYAQTKQKSLVIEALDFSSKKRELARKQPRAARMLSAFAYSSIINMLQAKAFRCGVSVFAVNPAYSSVIGRVKFARIYSQLSVHQAAALVIARRFFRFSERLPSCWNNIPLNTGRHVTLQGLVKISVGHVWRTWAKVTKLLQEVHAAPYRKFQKVVKPPSETWIEEPLPIWCV